MTPARPHPIAALVAMVVIWGYSWIVMKIALRHAHPFDFAAWRVGLGSIFLFLLVKLMGRPLGLSGYRMAVALGLMQVALFVGLSHFALLHAGPGKTSVLVFTMPFWMIVFAHFIIHERMRGAQWIAVALAFAGLTLIVAPWELTNLTGSLLAALSILHPHDPIRWNPEFLWTLAFSTILATGIGWWLWTYVLSRTPAGIAGLNALGIPVVAVLASWLQLGERPPPLELTGMLMIGIALALLAWLGLRSGR